MGEAFDLLVVDDEPVVLDAARKLLAAEGLRADLALDREMALEKLERRSYRAVLCDLVLPRVSGFEFVETILERLPGAPLILITGYATLQNATEGFKRNVFDFIPKPFDYGELAGVVQRALDFAAAPGGRDPRPSPGGSSSRLLRLGGHAWVALESDGSARIGLGENFATMNEAVDELELPESGETVLQGNRCARWTTRGRLVHRLWAPLSGRVKASSPKAFSNPGKRGPDFMSESWVLHVVPSNLELEVATLTQR